MENVGPREIAGLQGAVDVCAAVERGEAVARGAAVDDPAQADAATSARTTIALRLDELGKALLKFPKTDV